MRNETFFKAFQEFSSYIFLCWKSGSMHGFSKQLPKLDVMVRRMITESFGIEKYIEEHLNSTNYLLRMISIRCWHKKRKEWWKYSPPPDNDDGDDEETKLSLCSHTDKNTITVVHQYQVDGLEIKTKDEKWLKVTPSHHSFIIMDGDSLCVGSSTF